jgi:hypothetical protein
MISIETERNLIGIPIEGSITGIGERRTQQLPIEDLQPLLQAVNDDPGIHSFGWRQYTPYYNDGEQCVFSVGNAWFLAQEDVWDAEDRALRAEDYYRWEEEHSFSGRRGFAEKYSESTYDEAKRRYLAWETPNPRFDKERSDRCQALAETLWSGQFDLALLAKFGDHAIVTIINRDKITVEFYEHE